MLTKRKLRILRYIHKKKSVSYSSMTRKFKKKMIAPDELEQLVRENFIIQVGGSQTNLGEPIPITSDTIFQLDESGIVEVEKLQFFNAEYVFSSLIIPILVGVISSVITALLLAILA